MKTKDKKALHLKNLKELRKSIMDTKDVLVDLKLDKVQNKLKNTRQLFIKRREIAQMLTIIREKELSENPLAGGAKKP